jgi:hypothetical protein
MQRNEEKLRETRRSGSMSRAFVLIVLHGADNRDAGDEKPNEYSETTRTRKKEVKKEVKKERSQERKKKSSRK